MLNLESHQYAMLKEMGIEIPNPSIPTERATDLIASKKPVDPSVVSAASKANAQTMSGKPSAPVEIPAAATKQPVLTTSERTQTISKMTWQELQQAVSVCDACPLCQSRTQSVLGVGSHESRWMIVGEAPGEQEDKQGEPFVGQAGKLLDKMLTPLNIARRPEEKEQPIYIANVLKCRPPRNRNPDLQEMVLCEPFLRRQIELIAPRVILAMGRFAVQTLLQSHEAIGKLRGKVHLYQNIPVVVTYHPAYLLRNPADKRKSWADLCLAADIFEKQTN